MKGILKWSAPRFVLGAVLSVAAVSAAFFIVTTYVSESSHEGKTGAASKVNHALPLTVSFPDGVTPTNPVPVSLMVENTANQPVELAGPVISIEVPSDPVCAEWLEVDPETAAGATNEAFAGRIAGTNTAALAAIPANSGPTSILSFFSAEPPVTKLMLRFKPSLTAGTDETSCAEQPVKVTAKLTTPS